MTVDMLMSPNDMSQTGNIVPNLPDPNTIAAYRMQRAVAPEGGRKESPFTDMMFDMMVPGRSAVRSVFQGNYADAAADAALSALPYGIGKLGRFALPAIAAYAASNVMQPTALAEDANHFPFISDPTEREAAEARYKNFRAYDTDPKNGRQTFSRDKTAAGRDAMVADEQNRVRQKLEGVNALQNFEKENADSVKGLTPDQQEFYKSISVPGDVPSTIQRRQEYLQARKAEADKAKQSFGEKWPEAMTALQAGSAAFGTLVPGMMTARRAGMLNKAATEGEAAYKAASMARPNASARNMANLRANQLDAYRHLAPLGAMEWGTSAAIPFVAGQVVPNAIDVARLQSHPEYPSYQHALKMLQPWQPEFWEGAQRAGMEGLGATAIGGVGGGAVRNFPEAYSRAGAVLKSLKELQNTSKALKGARGAAAVPGGAPTIATTAAPRPTRKTRP